jgi:hypothetical protein
VSPQKLQFLFVPSGVMQTFGGSPLQWAKPFAHTRLQTPITQVCWPAQGFPQAPQFIGSFWRFASQPSVGSLLQSVQPLSHTPTVHIPLVQAAVACGTVQMAPQAPQFAGSIAVFASHPFASFPSQFLNPLSQLPSAQAPFMHVCMAFGYCIEHAEQPLVVHPYIGSLMETHWPPQIFVVVGSQLPPSPPSSLPPSLPPSSLLPPVPLVELVVVVVVL